MAAKRENVKYLIPFSSETVGELHVPLVMGPEDLDSLERQFAAMMGLFRAQSGIRQPRKADAPDEPTEDDQPVKPRLMRSLTGGIRLRPLPPARLAEGAAPNQEPPRRSPDPFSTSVPLPVAVQPPEPTVAEVEIVQQIIAETPLLTIQSIVCPAIITGPPEDLSTQLADLNQPSGKKSEAPATGSYVVLLAGGVEDIYRELKTKLLKRRDMNLKYHWPYEAAGMPKDVVLVFILTDMISHNFESVMINRCKAANIPFVRTTRKWAQMDQAIEQQWKLPMMRNNLRSNNG